MPIRFQCGNGHALTVKDELIGATIRCPYCHETAVVPDPAADEDNSDDRPKRRTRESRGSGGGKLSKAAKLRRVRLGLGFHFARLMIFLASPLFFVFAIMIGAGASASREAAILGAAAVVIVGILVLIALLSTPILGIVGSILCAWVPKKKVQTFALIAFGLDLGGFGLGLATIALTLARIDAAVVILLQFLQMSINVAAWVMFMLFLRRLASYLEEWGSADEAGNLILFGAVVVLLPPLLLAGFSMLIALMATPQTRQLAGGILACVTLVGGIAWLIVIIKFMFRQLELLGVLREVLAKKAAGE